MYSNKKSIITQLTFYFCLILLFWISSKVPSDFFLTTDTSVAMPFSPKTLIGISTSVNTNSSTKVFYPEESFKFLSPSIEDYLKLKTEILPLKPESTLETRQGDINIFLLQESIFIF